MPVAPAWPRARLSALPAGYRRPPIADAAIRPWQAPLRELSRSTSDNERTAVERQRRGAISSCVPVTMPAMIPRMKSQVSSLQTLMRPSAAWQQSGPAFFPKPAG